ncbi:hypothetical protein B0H15DRAFT_537953 [Mycena belliarum]|uniref:Uncharacterized protein n=1 Tax=Mycena belliarum TaxID=1033014 RepID=A0AAD6XLH7_9AGAR|nr:hypothetical protein B0H15DRAFT_537953 [Mycena belliae]
MVFARKTSSLHLSFIRPFLPRLRAHVLTATLPLDVIAQVPTAMFVWSSFRWPQTNASLPPALRLAQTAHRHCLGCRARHIHKSLTSTLGASAAGRASFSARREKYRRCEAMAALMCPAPAPMLSHPAGPNLVIILKLSTDCVVRVLLHSIRHRQHASMGRARHRETHESRCELRTLRKQGTPLRKLGWRSWIRQTRQLRAHAHGKGSIDYFLVVSVCSSLYVLA